MRALPPDAPATELQKNKQAFLHVLGTDPARDTPVLSVGASPRVSALFPKGSDKCWQCLYPTLPTHRFVQSLWPPPGTWANTPIAPTLSGLKNLVTCLKQVRMANGWSCPIKA